MYYNMLNKAIYLLTEYQIFDYPIDKDTIEQVISDKHLKIITLKNLSTTNCAVAIAIKLVLQQLF